MPFPGRLSSEAAFLVVARASTRKTGEAVEAVPESLNYPRDLRYLHTTDSRLQTPDCTAEAHNMQPTMTYARHIIVYQFFSLYAISPLSTPRQLNQPAK
jgi:hypothetical protein